MPIPRAAPGDRRRRATARGVRRRRRPAAARQDGRAPAGVRARRVPRHRASRPAGDASPPGRRARLLDTLQRFAVIGQRGRQPVPDGSDLEHHHADGVGHDVVQFARDPGPFLGHRDPCGGVPLPLGLGGTRLRRLGLHGTLAYGEARDPGRRRRSLCATSARSTGGATERSPPSMVSAPHSARGLPLSHALTGGFRPYAPVGWFAAILGVSALLALVPLSVPTRRALRTPPVEAIGIRE